MTEHGKAPGSSEAEQMAWRRGKLAGLRSHGWDFPNDFKRSADEDGTEHTAARLQARYGDWEKAALEAEGLGVTLAGRLMNRRGPFLVLQEGSGTIQFYLAKGAEEGLRETVTQWDIGDIVAGTGTLEKSGKGDLYLNLTDARLLTKALRPLPDQYYGIADTELRYRRRYLDLIMNEASRETFRVRSQVVSAVRRFLEERRFMEVETPMMHVIPGGPRLSPLLPITTPWTCRYSCALPRSYTSSASPWAASSGCLKSTGISGTRGSPPSTTPSSPCWSFTGPTRTTGI